MTDNDLMRGFAAFKAQQATQDRQAEDRRALALMLRLSGPRPTQTYLIGRSPDCDITVDDEYASPQHARATLHDGGSVVVEDVGSTNGTFLNGHRVEGQEVMFPGDVLRVGRTEMPWNPPAPESAEKEGKS